MPDGTLTGALPAPLPPQARAGLFGKLPARGDFIREDLPRDFVDAWDGWWQRGLADTQRMAREDWRAAWLEAPVWRFVLPPGLCGRHGVLGLWMPSVDKAGRFFPLTIAATADADWAPLVGAMGAFLAAAEQALGSSLGRLFAVAEAYPELKADATIRELSEELTSTENKIAFARQAYNDSVLDYNNAQAQFPTLLIARLFGFAPSAILQATENAVERQAVRIQI